MMLLVRFNYAEFVNNALQKMSNQLNPLNGSKCKINNHFISPLKVEAERTPGFSSP